MHIKAVRTSIFKRNDDLVAFILSHIKTVHEGDVIVVTSKIVALAQGRVVKPEEKAEAIARDCQKVIRNRWVSLTLRKGEWCVNAGADESNAFGYVILLPRNEFSTANKLHAALKERYGLKQLGLILTDTRSIPLRRGVGGIALSHAGFEPVKSYAGKKDLFGRQLAHTKVNVADSLAAIAVFAMGEGDESTPLAVISRSRVVFTSKRYFRRTTSMDPMDDLYKDVYQMDGLTKAR